MEFAAVNSAEDIKYENTANGSKGQKRLIECVCTLYRKNDLTGLLPLGRIQSLALPGESYKRAFTPGLLNTVFSSKLTPDTIDSVLMNEGGYVHFSGGQNWWIPSGQIFYSLEADILNPGKTADQELVEARKHFFMPRKFADPFGQCTKILYDYHDLLIVETQDPLENIVTVNTTDDGSHSHQCNDYRVLQPYWISDPNGNRTRVVFDALGLVVASAVMGKPGENKGDLINASFEPDLDLTEIQDFVIDPHGKAQELLQTATTRIVYDLDRYHRCGQPPFAATLAREIHFHDLDDGKSPIQISFQYSDGFGREIQTKIQAEAGDAPARAPNVPLSIGDIQPGELERRNQQIVPKLTNQRWVGTGRTVYNNKGKPVKEYRAVF